MSEHTDFYVGLFTKMHQANKQSGILDEYCWTHDPGGWTCLHCHLIAFFEGIGAIARKIQEGTRDNPTTTTNRP